MRDLSKDISSLSEKQREKGFQRWRLFYELRSNLSNIC